MDSHFCDYNRHPSWVTPSAHPPRNTNPSKQGGQFDCLQASTLRIHDDEIDVIRLRQFVFLPVTCSINPIFLEQTILISSLFRRFVHSTVNITIWPSSIVAIT